MQKFSKNRTSSHISATFLIVSLIQIFSDNLEMEWDLKSFQARVLDQKKLGFISELQKNLMKNSLRLVKPDGGIVVYATCSLSYSQNENIIQEVMSDPSFKDCRIVDALDGLEACARSSMLQDPIFGVTKSSIEGCYRFLPDSLSTGGLFLAKIVRAKSQLD